MSDILFEPIIINYGNTEWINPDIENLCKFGKDDINEGLWSTKEVFRITLNNKKSYLEIICRSSLLKDYWDEYIEYLGDDNNKNLAYSKTRLKSKNLHDVLFNLIEVTLREDVWTPGGEQFYFTEFGKQIEKFLSQGYTFTHSPDVNISKDSDTEYSWST